LAKENRKLHPTHKITAFDQGLAQQLADHLKAPCYALSELKAESLYHTVKEEMARPMKK